MESRALLLITMVQLTKGKVELVSYFRELNSHVVCHTESDSMDVCEETLRECPQMMVIKACGPEVNLIVASGGHEVMMISAGQL